LRTAQLSKRVSEKSETPKVCLAYIASVWFLTIPAAAASSEDANGLGNLFSDPNMLGKIASNPRTSKYLSDPAFVQKVLYSPVSD